MKIFVGYKKYHVEKRCTQYVFIVNIKKKNLRRSEIDPGSP